MAATNRLSDHFLEMAERHFSEGEQRVLRQKESDREIGIGGRRYARRSRAVGDPDEDT